ncbi:unnamed protein product, partial [Dicrocoelium dendriticum]
MPASPTLVDGKAMQIKQEISARLVKPEDLHTSMTLPEGITAKKDDATSHAPVSIREEVRSKTQRESPMEPVHSVQMASEISEMDLKSQPKLNEAQVATKTGEQERTEFEKQYEVREDIKTVEPVSQLSKRQVTREESSQALSVSTEAKAGERNVEPKAELEESAVTSATEATAEIRMERVADTVEPIKSSVEATVVGEQEGSKCREVDDVFSEHMPSASPTTVDGKAMQTGPEVSAGLVEHEDVNASITLQEIKTAKKEEA